jgi:hypothetical protein
MLCATLLVAPTKTTYHRQAASLVGVLAFRAVDAIEVLIGGLLAARRRNLTALLQTYNICTFGPTITLTTVIYAVD